jgi:hypothetical protein
LVSQAVALKANPLDAQQLPNPLQKVETSWPGTSLSETCAGGFESLPPQALTRAEKTKSKFKGATSNFFI